MIVPRQRPDDPAGELSAWLRAVAAHMSPEAAKMAGEVERGLLQSSRAPGPRPATIDADNALRRLKRLLYPAISANAAATEMARLAARYEAVGWKRDREAGLAPTEEPHRTFFKLLTVDKKLSQRSIRRAIEGERL
ncbi:hypothetical protein [Methylopila sp. M107]|uniref:hypothetical protein n=1 Tax=Methylopila sp. M107 TaxID=1101190 RepID=UPI00035CBE73|nr:hypothetical protein [Methylopila sp. M107]